MKKFVLAAAIAALTATAGAQNITTVNGKPVPKSRVDQLLNQVSKSGKPITPELEAQAKDRVVLYEIFMQAAEKAGIPQNADYKAQLELQRQNLLIQTLFTEYAKKNPATEEQAKAAYEAAKASAPSSEYKARHILVESEDQAKALIGKIKLGAKFEELAKTESKDPGSAANGGDVGWSDGSNFVPEFGAALAKLKKGEMTETPVKTDFGYHIILLDDTRPVTFPAYDDVKAQIMQNLTQQKVGEYQAKLKDAAKTDYKFTPR